MADSDIVVLARRFLLVCQPMAFVRNNLQDMIWNSEGHPVIPERSRREPAQVLSGIELFLEASKFDELLDELWDSQGPLQQPMATFIFADNGE